MLFLISTFLFSFATQAKATADLVRAAERGDLATVQDCLSKEANIETTDWVRCVFIRAVVPGISFDLVHVAIFHRVKAF